MKKTAVFILAVIILLSFASCSSDSNDEPSMDIIQQVFSDNLDTETYYADNKTSPRTNSLFNYMNNFDTKKTEWFFDYTSSDGNLEIAIVKVKNEGYLNTAKRILEDHLAKNTVINASDSEIAKQVETSVFIYQKYAVLFKSFDVISLKNHFFTFLRNGTLPSTSTTEISSESKIADVTALTSHSTVQHTTVPHYEE